MTHRYRQILVLLILLMTALTFQGCYTILKMRTGDIIDGSGHADACINGSLDAYVYEYDSWYDPLYVHHSYYAYPYAGSYCSPWIHEYAYSYPVQCALPGSGRDEKYMDDGIAQPVGKGERRRGAGDTADLWPQGSQAGHTTSSPVMRSETGRTIKPLRKVGTAPFHEGGISSETSRPPAMAPQTGTSAMPSFSNPGSSVSPTTRSTSTSTSTKNAPPERRRSATD